MEKKSFEVGANKDKRTFVSPFLFLNSYPFKNLDCHDIEVFGPVATIMPYKDVNEAIKLAGWKNLFTPLATMI